MSVDEIFPDRAQVLSPEEEEIMSGLDEQMEKCCDRTDEIGSDNWKDLEMIRSGDEVRSKG